MVKIQFDLSETADHNVIMFQAKNKLKRKEEAVNKMLELFGVE